MIIVLLFFLSLSPSLEMLVLVCLTAHGLALAPVDVIRNASGRANSLLIEISIERAAWCAYSLSFMSAASIRRVNHLRDSRTALKQIDFKRARTLRENAGLYGTDTAISPASRSEGKCDPNKGLVAFQALKRVLVVNI